MDEYDPCPNGFELDESLNKCVKKVPGGASDGNAVQSYQGEPYLGGTKNGHKPQYLRISVSIAFFLFGVFSVLATRTYPNIQKDLFTFITFLIYSAISVIMICWLFWTWMRCSRQSR